MALNIDHLEQSKRLALKYAKQSIAKHDVICDVDDLWHPEQLPLLQPLADAHPGFKLVCYTVPNRFGPVTPELRAGYPWVIWGIHGWEHTHFECLLWTDAMAERYIAAALAMGYDPVFKAPNWLADESTWRACKKLDVLYHHHDRDARAVPEGVPGLTVFPGPPERRHRGFVQLHTHLQPNAATDWLGVNPLFEPEVIATAHGYLTPWEMQVVMP